MYSVTMPSQNTQQSASEMQYNPGEENCIGINLSSSQTAMQQNELEVASLQAASLSVDIATRCDEVMSRQRSTKRALLADNKPVVAASG